MNSSSILFLFIISENAPLTFHTRPFENYRLESKGNTIESNLNKIDGDENKIDEIGKVKR